MLVIDRWGTILRADGANDGFLGYDTADLVGRNAVEYVATDDQAHVASVFAGGGDWILSRAPTPFPLRIVAADGTIDTVECLPARVDGDQWVLTLTTSELQFSTYHALDLYLDGAGPLEVATGVAQRGSRLWPEGVVTDSFVLHANVDGVLTDIVAGDVDSGLLAAMRECVTDPDAPWNSATATMHGPADFANLPTGLAEIAETAGLHVCELGIVVVDGAVEIATVTFGTHPSAFDGSTRVIHGKAVEMIEAAAQRARVERILRVAAETDHLTGLLNRAAFEHALAERDGREEQVSVVFIDLDNFKGVNDNYGHAVGDAVLIEAARRIASVCRPTDVIARFGGDEFAVLLPGADDENAVRVGQRIIDRIAQPLPSDIGPARVTATAGLASGLDHLVELVDSADHAMLRGKRAGRANVSTAPVDEPAPVAQPPIAR